MRVVSVVVFGVCLTAMGAGSVRAEECSVSVLCPPPTVPEPSPTPPPTTPPAPEPAPAPAPAPEPAPAPAPAAGDEAASATELVRLVNGARADRGLSALSVHAAAGSIALEHTREMAAAHDIWHNDELFTAETKRRLAAKTVGENVALNSTAKGAHDRLMASDGHRANILAPQFTAIAVGAVRGDDGRLYVTQVFVESTATAAAPAAATPTSARPAPAPKAKKAAAKPAAPAATTAPASAPTTAVEVEPAVGAETLSSDPAGFGDDELAAGRTLRRPARADGGSRPGAMAAVAAIALLSVIGALVAVRRRTIAG